MNLLSRAGWLLCAVLFATVLSSILHVDGVGRLPELLLAGVVVFACVSPHRALIALLAVVPVALYLATQTLKWNASLGWADGLRATSAWPHLRPQSPPLLCCSARWCWPRSPPGSACSH